MLPKPGRHGPSLDMPCGLLGIRGRPTAPAESNQCKLAIHPQESLFRAFIIMFALLMLEFLHLRVYMNGNYCLIAG